MSEHADTSGLDFANDGIAFSELEDGKPIAGQVNGGEVLFICRGEACFAVGATCTHYDGPLVDGIVEAKGFLNSAAVRGPDGHLTRQGWLIIYHGVADMAGKNRKSSNCATRRA